MRAYIPLILTIFSALIGSAMGSNSVDLEAAIVKLELAGATRISKLPLDSVYSFDQKVMNTTSGQIETITYSPTVRELINGFETPITDLIFKRADPQFGIVCETSLASPLAIDVIKILADINFKERQYCCREDWDEPSKCFTMANHGTASLGICGPYMRCVGCDHVIDFILLLVDRCKYDDAPRRRIIVGGRFVLGNYGPRPPYGGHLTVFHS